MAEWPIAPHLKCGILARGSGVRIPLSPPDAVWTFQRLKIMKNLIISEIIEQKIYLIRGQKVMLDRDLASLYQVDTRSLNQAVKRNLERFPREFMFQLNNDENKSLISQSVISNTKRGGTRHLPYAFTEHGILMLSSVLNSKRAIQVNIEIMKTFIKMRKMLAMHKDILRKVEEMEKRYDKQFRIVFQIIRGINQEGKNKRQIGFHP